MGVMRKALLVVVSAATAVVIGASPGAGAGTASAGERAGAPDVFGAFGNSGESGDSGDPRAIAPEADLAHHGRASLWDGKLTVRIASENHGPSGLPDATVRLDFSALLEAGQSLPSECLWGGDRTVLCRTGHLRAAGRGRELALDLRTAGSPAEVVVSVATAWNGGASDRNPENHQHRVLTPDTGDSYVF
ncbi:hypothetical protein [Streptomyces sp. AK02-01A]|uniref:hypothetical protein n=1 Tax=Streptomyces sp. AK02-01A TaxID=3028648 RepID=UPI0029A98D60|nr:hypothetical protein [Streptomyces sp. AK02-01A]MDX3851095.1 hypothetical protein [Streptomyces sp. AK02-01A]